VKQSFVSVEPVVETITASSAPMREAARFPVASTPGPFAGFTKELTEGSLAKAPENDVAQSAPSADAARAAVCSALSEGGHVSAAQLLGAGEWIIDGASLRIEVGGIGKKMLSLTVNAAAEKIVRQELLRLGASSRFLIVPGATNGSTPAALPVPLAGSVQEDALKNPLVQRAKEIFHAEVRSVVDLRVK
jgi:DNA polymerase-3 subunit gamma/tau